jgi:hydrogenase expression/formation protein HypC
MCVAVPLKVKRVEGEWAILEAGSGEFRARTDLVAAKTGDYVLVHAGFVIEKIDPKEAQKTLDMFAQVFPDGR